MGKRRVWVNPSSDGTRAGHFRNIDTPDAAATVSHAGAQSAADPLSAGVQPVTSEEAKQLFVALFKANHAKLPQYDGWTEGTGLRIVTQRYDFKGGLQLRPGDVLLCSELDGSCYTPTHFSNVSYDREGMRPVSEDDELLLDYDTNAVRTVAPEPDLSPECTHPIDGWVHDYDPDSRLGDAYYCGGCGELMQVG